MFIDSHAHFDTCIFDAHLEEQFIIDSMASSKVDHAVHVATEIQSFKWALEFSLKYKHIFFAAGIHPSEPVPIEDIEELELLVKGVKSGTDSQRLIAIGEIGLDYHHTTVPKEKQYELFEKQLEIAQKYNLPVIIHSRDAMDDTISILKNSKVKGIVIHCYSGNSSQAESLLSMGCYISFAGNLTFKKADNLRQPFMIVPEDRLLLETDCPYLSPEPVRGQKNHPANVAHLYRFASDLKENNLEDFAKRIKLNFEKLFNIEC